MRERLEQEFALLRSDYEGAQLGDNWVLLPQYILPPGRFNLEETPLLFAIPLGYPNTGPDNFFVNVRLRLNNGEPPAAFNTNASSSSGPAPVPGEWGWFSWHPQGWRPAADPASGDNLLTFVRGAGMCLRGEQTE